MLAELNVIRGAMAPSLVRVGSLKNPFEAPVIGSFNYEN
jgi:hypothetical protein